MPSLWLMFLNAEHRLLPVIVPIDDLPAEPDDLFVRNLAEVVDRLIDAGDAASVALLLSRPGSRAMREADRVWARALRAALGVHATWPIPLATRDTIAVFAPDDLLVA